MRNVLYLAVLMISMASTLMGQGLTREIYTDLFGRDLDSIKLSPKFKLSPDVYDIQPLYESPQSFGNDYGVHLRGYIMAPVTGQYTFYFASDDSGELYISTDGTESGKQLTAYTNMWTGYRQFDKFASQKSAAVSLVAGQVIYTESWAKQRGGGDHLSVAWSIDGGPLEVIPGAHLTPYYSDFSAIQTSLSNSITAAESLYETSALNMGTEEGEYSEAMRFIFQLQIDEAKSILATELSNAHTLAYAQLKLAKAHTAFDGGVKPVVLSGKAFGSYPYSGNAYSPEMAFDTNPTTGFTYLFSGDGYVGIDLGENNETAVSRIRFLPENDKGVTVGNNRFQGSVDGINYVDLYTIPNDTDDSWQEVNFVNNTAYRYYRYYDDAQGYDYARIAELEFIGLAPQAIHMKNLEVLTFSANTADQVLSSDSLLAHHGSIPAQFLTYTILELPVNGFLKLNGVDLTLTQTFTQEDIDNGLVTFSSDGSRAGTTFRVEVSSAIGGLLPEVIIEIEIDSDGDGLTDSQEISMGTNPDAADTDGDGLDDSWEAANGLDALVNNVETLVAGINGESGLTASYNFGVFSSVNDLPGLNPVKVKKVSSLNFPDSPYQNNFANSGAKYHVGAQFKGYLYVPVGGSYKFSLSSDDGSKLTVGGIPVITNDGIHAITKVENTVTLTAGLHSFSCDFFQNGGYHGLILEWEGPGRAREIIPSSHFYLSLDEHQAEIDAIDRDQDGLTDLLEAQEGTDPLNPDTDGDRLSDGEEYHAVFDYKTNPLSVDTDGDTVSDYDEIFMFYSNPLIPDFDGTTEDTISIIPSKTSSRLGEWQDDGEEIFLRDGRGYVEYTVRVPIPGLYRFDIEAAQDIVDTSRSEFDLHLYVDGEFVGRQKKNIVHGEPEQLSFLSTNLRAGQHTFRIFWENVYTRTTLRIKSLTLSKPGGPDENNNGNPDWVDNYHSLNYSIDPYNSSSKVSPAQIEGKGRYLSKFLKSFDEPVQRGTFNRWFADLTLTKEAPKEFTIEFEHGLSAVTGQIIWEETNILDEGSMTVREGSSMLLNAVIDGDTDSSSTITVVDDSGNSSIYSAAPNAPLEYKFETAGTYSITADYAGSQAVSGSLTIKVVGAPEVDSPYLWRGKPRFWNWDGLSEELILQAEGMELTKEVDGYTLKRNESLESVNIVARLGENGPVIKSLETHSFWIRDVVESVVAVVEILEDGTKITNDTVFAWGLTDGMEVKVNTISGVTFPDGSMNFTLTKDHFDELNCWTLELIKSPDRTGANCHWYRMWQNGTFVGEKNK